MNLSPQQERHIDSLRQTAIEQSLSILTTPTLPRQTRRDIAYYTMLRSLHRQAHAAGIPVDYSRMRRR